jgi:hypothetical protein
MKVSKEDIIGVVTALEYWFGERDRAAERQQWYDDLATIAKRVESIPGATGEILEPQGVDRVPRLKITWDHEKYPLDGLGLRGRTLDGEPRVMLDDNSATENSIAIDPFQLQPGEASKVGDAVVAALLISAQAEPVPVRPPALEIAGNWELRVDLQHASRIHRLALQQSGNQLAGHQQSERFDGPVKGAIEADAIRFSFDGRHDASNISFVFEGTVRNGSMAGTVAVGAASDSSNGPVNRSQFGSGEWEARRVA